MWFKWNHWKWSTTLETFRTNNFNITTNHDWWWFREIANQHILWNIHQEISTHPEI
jgi:hypothetical protein